MSNQCLKKFLFAKVETLADCHDSQVQSIVSPVISEQQSDKSTDANQGKNNPEFIADENLDDSSLPSRESFVDRHFSVADLFNFSDQVTATHRVTTEIPTIVKNNPKVCFSTTNSEMVSLLSEDHKTSPIAPRLDKNDLLTDDKLNIDSSRCKFRGESYEFEMSSLKMQNNSLVSELQALRLQFLQLQSEATVQHKKSLVEISILQETVRQLQEKSLRDQQAYDKKCHDLEALWRKAEEKVTITTCCIARVTFQFSLVDVSVERHD